MFAFGLRKVFLFVLSTFVAGGLVAGYLVSGVISAEEKPLEGAGELVESGKSSVAEAPEMPELQRESEKAGFTMTASYYGYALAGLPTASGEPFDPEKHTAAHKSLPLGTELLVKRGDESVKVTVNDRGPYVAGRDLDLSQGAAEEIGLIGPGEDEVKVIEL